MDDKKKRLLILVLFGVAAVAALLLWMPEPRVTAPAVVPPMLASPATGAKASAPTLPQGADTAGLVIRDIFSPPAEFSPQVTIPAFTGPLRNGGSFDAGMTPVLTGVIEGSDRRVAILRQGAVSRSYRIGESAGAYRITAISARSVTLSGPGGTTVLTMGQ
ncbi:MAG: hypothetical protein AB9917_08765 [Negativicutes bacterium]